MQCSLHPLFQLFVYCLAIIKYLYVSYMITNEYHLHMFDMKMYNTVTVQAGGALGVLGIVSVFSVPFDSKFFTYGIKW